MTHDELLDNINMAYGLISYVETSDKELSGLGIKKYFDALRLVVELHKPKKGFTSPRVCSSDTCQEWIESMYEPHTYPCPTIQAIDKELG